MTANMKRTELQQVCEDMRIAQLHLVNLLTVALKEADDELESIVAGAIKFSQDDYELWARISAIADGLAEKVGDMMPHSKLSVDGW